MNKAALYVRVSTMHQIDKDSLPFQKQELSDYSKYVLKINDFVIFEDAGFSGKNTERPKYQEMMSRVRAGEFSHLIVWKIDRISRNLLDFTAMFEELKKLNVTFISRNEQFDTSSAMGEAMLKIVLVFAELERKMAAERVTSIMMSRAEKGKWNGANVPLGYKWSDEKKFPIPYEQEADTVRLIYSLYSSMKSSNAVANELAERGLKTKRGGKWGSKRITDVIRNPFYKGTYRYNYRESARGAIKPESEWIIIDDNHDAIINKDLWEKCNFIMDKNAERNSASLRRNSHVHVFSGLLYCSECGEKFIVSPGRARKDGYRPSRYRCKDASTGRGCHAKMITDIVLGPFVINLIANIMNVFYDIDKYRSAKAIEKDLLKGEAFIGVSIKNGLDDLYTVLKKAQNVNIPFAYVDDIDTGDDTSKLSAEREIKKITRALERLDDLYLFDDIAMSEKDYILKKKKLVDQLDSNKSKLMTLSKSSMTSKDSLITLSSTFLMTSELKSHSYIDYKELCSCIGKTVIKEFVNSIIERIVIVDGHVGEVVFLNGVVIEF